MYIKKKHPSKCTKKSVTPLSPHVFSFRRVTLTNSGFSHCFFGIIYNRRRPPPTSRANFVISPPSLYAICIQKIVFGGRRSIKRRGISVARRFELVSDSTAWKMVRAPAQGALKIRNPNYFYNSRLPRYNFSSLSSKVSSSDIFYHSFS